MKSHTHYNISYMSERRYDIDWIRVVSLFFVSWVLYEFIIRRIALLRSLFGLKSERKVMLNEEFLIRNTFDL